jgi:hypothetical protein
LTTFVFVAAFVIIAFAYIFIVDERKFNRMKRALALRRPNPMREEFVALLAPDCEADIAELMWEELLVF